MAIKEYLPAQLAVRSGTTEVLPRSRQDVETFKWGRHRFLDEAQTLAKLENTPSVVGVTDFLEANGTAYFVMPLLKGESLSQLLQHRNTLPQAEIDRFLAPLLDGLERVHEAGFLHRDIKPANIIIGEDGRPTLIDFGAARTAIVDRTHTMTAIYTAGYAAPEQMAGDDQGPYSDIYALAATVYCCMTGEPPPNSASLVYRRSPGTTVPTMVETRYSSGLVAAVNAGLRLQIEDRPRTATEWRQYLSGAADVATISRVTPDGGPGIGAVVPAKTDRRSLPMYWAGIGIAAAVITTIVAVTIPWGARTPSLVATQPQNVSAAAPAVSPVAGAAEAERRRSEMEAGRRRLEQDKLDREKAEAARLEDERQSAEARRLEEERQRVEATRRELEEDRNRQERRRLAEERQRAEAARQEEERQRAEAKRLEDERQRAEATRHSLFTGRWAGVAVSGNRTFVYRWTLRQIGQTVDGTIYLAEQGGRPYGVYAISGSIAGDRLTFRGVRFIETDNPSYWCMVSGTVDRVTTATGSRLAGVFGPLTGVPSGCPAGTNGTIFLDSVANQ